MTDAHTKTEDGAARELAERFADRLTYPLPDGWKEDPEHVEALREVFPAARNRNIALLVEFAQEVASQPSPPVTTREADDALALSELALLKAGIDHEAAEQSGSWHTCSGCYDTEDGHPTQRYPYSTTFGCDLGNGCSECGGLGVVWDNTDYADMAEELAKPVEDPVSSAIERCAKVVPEAYAKYWEVHKAHERRWQAWKAGGGEMPTINTGSIAEFIEAAIRALLKSGGG
jgi:hypothetical protein